MSIRPQLQKLEELGKQLEQNENKRQKVLTFMQEAPCICFMKDAETGRYQFMSKIGCEAMGRTESEIVGKTDWELFPERMANSLINHDVKVLKERTPIVTIEPRSYKENSSGLSLVAKFIVVNGGESIGGLAFELPDTFRMASPLGESNGS